MPKPVKELRLEDMTKDELVTLIKTRMIVGCRAYDLASVRWERLSAEVCAEGHKIASGMDAVLKDATLTPVERSAKFLKLMKEGQRNDRRRKEVDRFGREYLGLP